MQYGQVAHQHRRVIALAAKRHIICQNRTMTRNDVLVWLSLAGLFAAYCTTFWVSFRFETNQPAAATMNRDDVFIWLSLFWFVALCGLVIWMLLSA